MPGDRGPGAGRAVSARTLRPLGERRGRGRGRWAAVRVS
jgi:hypothetical protein